MLSLHIYLQCGIQSIAGGGVSPLGEINREKTKRPAICFHLYDKANIGVKILQRDGLDFEMIQIHSYDSYNS